MQAAEKAHMPKQDHVLVEKAAKILADLIEKAAQAPCV